MGVPADAGWRLASSLYFLLVVFASFTVIDLTAASLILAYTLALLSPLPAPPHPLIAFKSYTLRTWMRIFIGHFEHAARMTLTVTGDPAAPADRAVVISNHRSWYDTVTLYSLARQVGGDGDVKFVAKNSLFWCPVFGFAGWVLDVVIFIAREAARDARVLDDTYAGLSDRGGWPFWLISYLEGTRRTRKKLAEAQAFARNRGLRPLQHVLQPRTKGFLTAVKALRGTATAVYDITLGYQEDRTAERDVSPDFLTALLVPTKTDSVIAVHQRRFDLADVPEGDEELKAWVYKLFEEKDKLLDEFYRTGKFPGRRVKWERMPMSTFLRAHASFWAIFFLGLYAARALLLSAMA